MAQGPQCGHRKLHKVPCFPHQLCLPLLQDNEVTHTHRLPLLPVNLLHATSMHPPTPHSGVDSPQGASLSSQKRGSWPSPMLPLVPQVRENRSAIISHHCKCHYSVILVPRALSSVQAEPPLFSRQLQYLEHLAHSGCSVRQIRQPTQAIFPA